MNNTNTAITATATGNTLSMFHSPESFALLQQQAEWIAKSDLLPKEFKGKPENCGIAMEMALRLGAGYFQIIQNMDVIHGRPSFRATFLMAMVNACGRFSPLEYRMEITGEEKTVPIEYEAWEGFGNNSRKVVKKLNYTYTPTTCRAVATDLRSGREVIGPAVSYDMAIEEGWVSKSGSKWQGAMRELMLTYRAGAFFSRIYASDLTLGMQTSEETHDTIEVEARDVTPPREAAQQPTTANPHRRERTEAKEAAPEPAKKADPKPKPEAKETPAATGQRGTIVIFEEIESASGESKGKPWVKFKVKYTENGTIKEAATFSEGLIAPLEFAGKGERMAIETEPSSNPKYAPTLTFLEMLPDAAPAQEKPKPSNKSGEPDLW